MSREYSGYDLYIGGTLKKKDVKTFLEKLYNCMPFDDFGETDLKSVVQGARINSRDGFIGMRGGNLYIYVPIDTPNPNFLETLDLCGLTYQAGVTQSFSGDTGEQVSYSVIRKAPETPEEYLETDFCFNELIDSMKVRQVLHAAKACRDKKDTPKLIRSKHGATAEMAKNILGGSDVLTETITALESLMKPQLIVPPFILN